MARIFSIVFSDMVWGSQYFTKQRIDFAVGRVKVDYQLIGRGAVSDDDDP
jgi:hypothetical protein